VTTDRNHDFRILILNLVIILGGIILIIQLFNLQIVNGESYREQSENRVLRKMAVTAPRGEFLDRHGEILATNRDGYNVLMYKTDLETEERNRLILNIVELFREKNTIYRDTFPIVMNEAGIFEFTFDTPEEEKRWKKNYKYEETATPDDVIGKLVKKYELENYTSNEARDILGIRYELDRVGYSAFKAYELATDVSEEVVAELEERFAEFPGVTVEIQPIRSYPNGSMASHILGYIGKISPEKYEELKDEGYSNNDNIGKDGLESVMEKYLRGTDSFQKVALDATGSVNGETGEYAAIPGDQVYLTIDAKLQKVAEDALKGAINKIATGGYTDGSSEAQSGAVIAIDVKNGEILAMASYPDYDPNLFVKGISNEEWKKLNVSTKPMFNRNILGLYSPGSIYKMVVAAAALEEGAITPDTIIVDEGRYTKYKSPQPKCWVWSDSTRRTHGPVNVSEAIKTSCNYFFYSVSELIGIDTIEKYTRMFGLGEKTGIELPGEKNGIVAGRGYVEAKENRKWLVGETLSAAIGQSYHSFTPIQIARYAAILANGGNRVQPHLIKSVIKADGTILEYSEVQNDIHETLGYEENDTIPEKIDLQDTTIDAIFSGMESVTGDSGGTAYNTFKDFPIKVAGKTGSVQVSGSSADNAWFIGFAPYDDPEIAICALVEHGVHGTYTAPIIVDILREYFGLKESENQIDTNAIVGDNSMM